MARRKAPRLRPTLDHLEGRIALSAIPPAAEVAPPARRAPTPSLTSANYGRVMKQIDWAFDDYKGRHQAAKTIANLASDVVTTLVTPNSTTDPNPRILDFGPSDRGDGVALEDRLREAVDRLPYGHTRVAPLIVQAWGIGGMTPENSSLFRDRFKAMVRHYVAGGLKDGSFTWSGPVPHLPAGPAGSTGR
jgi:hypothetical protein